MTMLKRIHVEQLRLGMHIHELCGSWMDHPFWRGAFALDNPKDLRTIRSTGIREVWIDTSRGLDVDDGADEEVIAEEIENTLAQADSPSEITMHTDLQQEAARAVEICARSRQAITAMFQETRMGKALDTSDAMPIVEEISSSVNRNPHALIGLARLKNKDDYTYMHSVAVCALMVALARQLGMDDEQTRQAGFAGLLHDIGKMMVPLEILNKPGKLTDAEFDAVKSHPAEGYRVLQESRMINAAVLDV